jgi:hypothetical protein
MRGKREIKSIKVRVQEEKVIKTFYTCPECNKEYPSESKAKDCLKGHEPLVAKYCVGDCVEFRQYSSDDYPEYLYGVIMEITFENGRIYYIIDEADEDGVVREDDVVKLVMSAEDRRNKIAEFSGLLDKIPDMFTTTLHWDINSLDCYFIVKKKKV